MKINPSLTRFSRNKTFLLSGERVLLEKAPVKAESYEARDPVRDGESQPEPVQAKAREEVRERHEKDDGAQNGERRASHTRPDRLEENRIGQRRHQRKETQSDKEEFDASDLHDEVVVREDAQQLFRNRDERKGSQTHE